MYVFRPQQMTGHAPGCSLRCGHHHVGRQAAKAQKRTQPKTRRRCPDRRRQQLRSLAGHAGQVGLRPRLTSGDAPEFHAEPADLVVDEMDCESRSARDGRRQPGGSTRARLCRRLVERSCTELVAALERRHGDAWPEHVLQGGFHAYEGMRRFCEAFGLRPDLELQVLRRATEEARIWKANLSTGTAAAPAAAAGAPSSTQAQGLCSRSSVAENEECFADGDHSCSCSMESDGMDSDSLDLTSTGWTTSLPFKEAFETLPSTSPVSATTTRCPSQERGIMSDSGTSQTTPDAGSSASEDDDAFFDSSDEATWELGFEMPVSSRSPEVSNAMLEAGAERGFAAAKRAAKRAAVELAASLTSVDGEVRSEVRSTPVWRSSWRKRVLRALGVERLWPSGGTHAQDAEESPTRAEPHRETSSSTASSSAPVSAGAIQEASEGVAEEQESEDEERLLSSKLVAAVQNAERQAAHDRAIRSENCQADPSVHAVPARSRSRQSSERFSVRFSRKSEVSFFAMHVDSSSAPSSQPLQADYRRPLHTKDFDGPSGHKAKRSPHSRECRMSEDEEEQEEWEDQCDDIAELMSQQRCCLMWSQAW